MTSHSSRARSIRDDVALALPIGRSADALTMDRFGALDLRIETKPDLTPVTDADRSAEELLRDLLAEHRPDDAVLGEEFGGTAAFAGRQWVLDPIDGTKNFVRGVPVWSTLIALLQDGVPVVGVVSAPAMQRRWWAGTDEGAFTSFRGDTRAHLGIRCRRRRIGQPVLLRSDHGLGRAAVPFLDLTDDVWRVRGYGDFWSYCLVAEGAVDIAVEPEVKLWDLAPLDVLVREAGGSFTEPRRLPAAPTAAVRWRPTACSTNGC